VDVSQRPPSPEDNSLPTLTRLVVSDRSSDSSSSSADGSTVTLRPDYQTEEEQQQFLVENHEDSEFELDMNPNETNEIMERLETSQETNGEEQMDTREDNDPIDEKMVNGDTQDGTIDEPIDAEGKIS
jgi:hypothetical protein